MSSVELIETNIKKLNFIVVQVNKQVKALSHLIPKKAIENFMVRMQNAKILIKLAETTLADAKEDGATEEEISDILRWLDNAHKQFNALKDNLRLLEKDINYNANIHPKTRDYIKKKKQPKTISMENYSRKLNFNSLEEPKTNKKSDKVHFRELNASNNNNGSKRPAKRPKK
jgi:hypothetical protein